MGLEKIEQLKRKLNLTSKELSESSGVPLGTLNKILNGTTKDPKLETLKSLARVLGCTLDDFDDIPIIKNHDNYTNLAPKEKQLLTDFNKLNDLGKKSVLTYTNDLSQITKYKIYEEPSHLMPIASHDKEGDFTEEEYKHDDDIMSNPDNW
ncbi:MAG: helix-turn-helix domain-containing protein [Clostridium sp.]|uniref:helix-turn-helix domain-containing protein n=1 Tax=Clostridium sp. TaxID=1506 RepID=UPI003F34FBAB